MEDGQTGVAGVLVQWHVRVRLITNIEQGRVRVLPSIVAVMIVVDLTPVITLATRSCPGKNIWHVNYKFLRYVHIT